MRIIFEGQLKELNTEMRTMGGLCEDIIEKTVRCLLQQDARLIRNIIELAETISAKEREIEAMCIKLIMKQQPVAKDLRVISAALKMVTDLNRIADQSMDIAEILRTGSFQEKLQGSEFDAYRHMGEAVKHMVEESIDAFQSGDVRKAQAVLAYDDIVDEDFRSIRNGLIQAIEEKTRNSERVIDLLMIAKYLERIGDHAANVANWVAFSITGEILPDN